MLRVLKSPAMACTTSEKEGAKDSLKQFQSLLRHGFSLFLTLRTCAFTGVSFIILEARGRVPEEGASGLALSIVPSLVLCNCSLLMSSSDPTASWTRLPGCAQHHPTPNNKASSLRYLLQKRLATCCLFFSFSFLFFPPCLLLRDEAHHVDGT